MGKNFARGYYACVSAAMVISLRRHIMFDATRVCSFASKSPKSVAEDTTSQKCRDISIPSYENAIQTLNTLQSNAVTIQKSINRQQNNIDDTARYLQKTGIPLCDLDKLPVIHVSGTKGKGSTCALTESILRSFGVRTGFFSSPHLISVTERFRINGESISQDDFTRHFWYVYNCLSTQKDHKDDMPPYFKFLTIMCFHIFIEKKVDVAIMEVGIGGENDCTNVVRNTKTVGITSLGLEHTRLLGNTIEEIAWQKAGIIKSNSNVFTSSQPAECIDIIRKRAKEKNAQLFIAPDFSEYNWQSPPKLQITNKIQKLNASLAIQLAYDWLKRHKLVQLNEFVKDLSTDGLNLTVCDRTIKGLEECFWPGRGQIIEFQNKKLYLDGAHTKESLEICLEWFIETTSQNGHPKCLVFNAGGDRDSKQLLRNISAFSKIFNIALFVPNVPFQSGPKNPDNTSVWSHQEQIKRAEEHRELWAGLSEKNQARNFGSVLEAFRFLQNEFSGECDVLITGSIHLIGATLQALEAYNNREIVIKN